MDSLSFFGLLIALVAVLGGMVMEGGEVMSLVNLPAFIIVFGGTLGAVMLQSPGKQFALGLSLLSWVFKTPVIPVEAAIKKIIEWAQMSRQHGYLSLEQDADHEPDAYTQKGLNLLIDGVEPDTLRDAMDMEMTLERERLLRAAKVFEAMGGYSPTIGIIGAVLGLIQAMGAITNPEDLGSGIATAFVATIYGVGFANFLFLPVANKLKSIIYRQTLYREMITEGLISIARGENPRAVELKLNAYLD